MIHEIFPVGILGCNCSILGDEVTHDAIVIDPGDDVERIFAILQRHGLRVKSIVITHAHIDHIGGAYKLRAVTGAPVAMHPADKVLSDHLDLQAGWLGIPAPPDPGIDQPLAEGDTIRAGAIEANVLHTPGHTPGSVSLYLPDEEKLIAGDTLFQGSIGRTDFPGGNMEQILQSIEGKLYRLPENTLVISGHGGNTSIGEEKRSNPFVRG